jgi:hypothetical protein
MPVMTTVIETRSSVDADTCPPRCDTPSLMLALRESTVLARAARTTLVTRRTSRSTAVENRVARFFNSNTAESDAHALAAET